ncbi:MAG: hypothetical protein LUE93_08045 [Bacteroides sp.]|nr:hypothetical protein [Bacteroides sp.]
MEHINNPTPLSPLCEDLTSTLVSPGEESRESYLSDFYAEVYKRLLSSNKEEYTDIVKLDKLLIHATEAHNLFNRLGKRWENSLGDFSRVLGHYLLSDPEAGKSHKTGMINMIADLQDFIMFTIRYRELISAHSRYYQRQLTELKALRTQEGKRIKALEKATNK